MSYGELEISEPKKPNALRTSALREPCGCFRREAYAHNCHTRRPKRALSCRQYVTAIVRTKYPCLYEIQAVHAYGLQTAPLLGATRAPSDRRRHKGYNAIRRLSVLKSFCSNSRRQSNAAKRVHFAVAFAPLDAEIVPLPITRRRRPV